MTIECGYNTGVSKVPGCRRKLLPPSGLFESFEVQCRQLSCQSKWPVRASGKAGIRNPESGIGTGIGTGTGTGTGIGTGMGRETYIKAGTTFTLI